MKVSLVDEKKIEIEPETTAELLALRKFDGATVTVKKPVPFAVNAEHIQIEAK